MRSPTLTTRVLHAPESFYPAPEWSFLQLSRGMLLLLRSTVPVPASTLSLSQALPGLDTLQPAPEVMSISPGKLAVPDSYQS